MSSVRIINPNGTITISGNWGNPALSSGADFGQIFASVTTGQQGVLPQSTRQLIFGSYNNSYISAASGFTLSYTTDTAFADADSGTYATATVATTPQGAGTWYTYSTGGFVDLTDDFVFYVTAGGSEPVYAFAFIGFTTAGDNTSNQGTYTFEVKTL
ncbi:hypothetical protein [Sinomicrobium soli]|uniref:hypothetical protein n=1 Tax=Sinomicrobium sp. N-1-3-6 TaxID=2219864 RepID=UPI000DCB1F84|nr:hypothetical protein [Sinomicrobium sp. N-1-3-6]RAV28318.1 hypothetical protein DN748_14275 [Sinomicrobium sp. N-1-3-6]